MALFGHGGMSDPSPLCAQKRTQKTISKQPSASVILEQFGIAYIAPQGIH